MAGDDDQNHTRGHDPDRGRLHRKVPKISRRQKRPEIVDHLAVNMKSNPDHHQRGNHSQQPRVNLGGPNKPREHAFILYLRGACICKAAHIALQIFRMNEMVCRLGINYAKKFAPGPTRRE